MANKRPGTKKRNAHQTLLLGPLSTITAARMTTMKKTAARMIDSLRRRFSDVRMACANRSLLGERIRMCSINDLSLYSWPLRMLALLQWVLAGGMLWRKLIGKGL
jgi:hypothetical protein